MVRDPARLSTKARNLLSDRGMQIAVPAAAAWELAIKLSKGKFPDAAPIVADYPAVLLRLGASSLAHTHTHMLHAGQMEWDHRDPFDRLIAASAICEGIPLVTADAAFGAAPGLQRLW